MSVRNIQPQRLEQPRSRDLAFGTCGLLSPRPIRGKVRCRVTSVAAARLWFVSSNAPSYPWPAGSATGIGSMPGTDPAEACAVGMGYLPEFPYLPDLPARGVAGDILRRAPSLPVPPPGQTPPR